MGLFRKKQDENTTKCKECGLVFKTHYRNQKFCSEKCKYKYRKNNQGENWLELRWKIILRDNFTCQYCGRNVKEDKIRLQIDHIIPVSKGGKTIEKNLICACFECNTGKSNKM